MGPDVHRRLENALICGVLAWFFAEAYLHVPHVASLCGLPLALVVHILGIGYALSVIRKAPYPALAALGLNLSIWLMPLTLGLWMLGGT